MGTSKEHGVVHAKIDAAMLEQLRAIAKAQDRSVSGELHQAVAAHLEPAKGEGMTEEHPHGRLLAAGFHRYGAFSGEMQMWLSPDSQQILPTADAIAYLAQAREQEKGQAA